MTDAVTEADVGKPVVHDGATVGRVVDYQNGEAFVDPAPGIARTVAAKLGVEDHGSAAFPLQPVLVESVTDDEVRLTTDQ